MKPFVKKLLLVFGILVATGILFFFGVFLKLRSEIDKMEPVQTKQITDRIYAIRDSVVNAYLIQTYEGYIMIDAGNDIDIVKQELGKLNIDKNKIIAVFLTHSDYDHVASIPLFRNAKIYLSREEESMINGSKRRMPFQYNKIETDRYNTFVDGQLFHFPDITVRCILTPGHTPGATSYLINDKYLFTGDALSLKEGKADVFIKLANMDLSTHRKSIRKIYDLQNIEYIFTAHHGMTSDFDYTFSDWDVDE
jgi:glyoxylase-like metal-dependent hydrolase (beta-lactamase superfamily II)